ncbi:MAG: helix-turn-helix transcriptional regulator, partial [Proteobacteria bacterium]|nr:helix-turn-helix transcriptional regulator [Pseudomonadota bacterium]
EEIFEDFQLTDKSANKKTPLDIFWNLPKEIGTGSFRKTMLRTGFELYITDFKLREPLIMNRKSNSPVIGLNFALSGSIRNKIQYSSDDWIMDSGQSSLYYVPASNSSAEAAAREPILAVSIQMVPWFFDTLLARKTDRIPDDFGDIASGSQNGKYLYTDVITPLMQAVVHQILNCPYHGLTRQLYLEGKAYELIAYKLEQSLSNKKEYQKAFTLRPDDIECVHHARELVKRDIENPPRLLDLARAVGLSHPKLNFCFREIYGRTIFGYIRELRLNKAKSLLDEGKMNVTEVAYSVGYSGLSNFAKSFKGYFGTLPGKYLREISQRRN